MNEYLTIGIEIIVAIGSGIGGALLFLGKYREKIDHLEKNDVTNCAEIKTLTHRITVLETKLEERVAAAPFKGLARSKSPLALTTLGQTLLSASGADKFVLNNKDEFVNIIREKDPQTAYDVQVYARQVVESLQNDTRFNSFKDFVYKTGDDLESIFIVMSLYLRDIALPLLGFKAEDIDLNAPESERSK